MVSDNTTNVTIVVYADNVEEIGGLKPCYALTLSDTGYGEPTISCGLIDEKLNDMYFQSACRSLADNEDDLAGALQNAIADFAKVFAKHKAQIDKSNAKQVDVSTDLKRLSAAAKYVNKMPDYQRFIGDKAYKKVLQNFQELENMDEIPNMLPEYAIRSMLLQIICENTKAEYAKDHIKEHAGAELLGLSA